MKKQAILALVGACLAIPVHAAEPSFTVHAGRRSDVDSVGLGLRWSPWWSRERGAVELTVYPEVQLNHHRLHKNKVSGRPDSLWQAGGSAVAQVAFGNWALRPYVELGLGVNLFSESALGDDRFGSHFQFGEHLGAGLATRDGGFFAGLRISHYSNAGLKEPNNGLNTAQLLVGARF